MLPARVAAVSAPACANTDSAPVGLSERVPGSTSAPAPAPDARFRALIDSPEVPPNVSVCTALPVPLQTVVIDPTAGVPVTPFWTNCGRLAFASPAAAEIV
ncbi:MAG: hypothetical protein K2P78_02925 [Gemmataceae bacterium]|nr:hypothetical protein [Gemmataceae bacterium]